MQLSIFVFTLATTILLIAMYPSSSEAFCPCQGPEDCNENVICEFDEDRDECKRKICLMGPDQPCGRLMGKCSKGLHCNNCDFCSGCTSAFFTAENKRLCSDRQCGYKEEELPVY